MDKMFEDEIYDSEKKEQERVKKEQKKKKKQTKVESIFDRIRDRNDKFF